MTIDEQQFWTLIIAVGGLVIALVSCGWNIYLHAISRAKVMVTASIMQVVPKPPGLSKDDKVLFVEAINIRSRPVTIKGFYCECCKKDKDGLTNFLITGSSLEFTAYASTFPCQIKEGEVAKLKVHPGIPGKAARILRKK